jgi:hypothetical protein
LAIAVEEILGRLTRIRLDGIGQVEREAGIITSPGSLLITFDPRERWSA